METKTKQPQLLVFVLIQIKTNEAQKSKWLKQANVPSLDLVVVLQGFSAFLSCRKRESNVVSTGMPHWRRSQ